MQMFKQKIVYLWVLFILITIFTSCTSKTDLEVHENPLAKSSEENIAYSTISELLEELDINQDNQTYIKRDFDELGKIPIMMYHGIEDIPSDETLYTGGNVDEFGYNRTAEAFRNDLEFYYKSGYRMIRLSDYVKGIIDCEAGYSPIIITFDDGYENNMKINKVNSDGSVDIDEIEKNSWSLVPSKYIEFDKEQKDIDYSKQFKKINEELNNLFMQENESRNELKKILEEL